jgi:hypothetical protein
MGTFAVYLVGASNQMEGLFRPILALNPWLTLFAVPEQLSSQLAQVLPISYRPIIDGTAQQDLFGLRGLRYPRWALTLVLYIVLTLLFLGASSVAVDPCHRLREQRWARAIFGRGA